MHMYIENMVIETPQDVFYALTEFSQKSSNWPVQ